MQLFVPIDVWGQAMTYTITVLTANIVLNNKESIEAITKKWIGILLVLWAFYLTY